MVQYRQLQSPAELNTSIPDTGAASAYESLASTFKNFSKDAFGAAAKIQTQRGAEAGNIAGASGKPGFKGALAETFTAYGAAYNNAAMRSYTIKASADAEDTAARLQVEAGTDAGKFQTTFGAVRDATIKQAPPEARGVLMDLYNQHMGQGVARINTARALELRDHSRTDGAEGIARLTEQAGNLFGQDDPVSHQQAEEAQVKLSMLIDGMKTDGTITDVEAAALHTDAAHKITAQTVVARFQKELDNPMGDPIAFINRLHEFNKGSNQLLPTEKEKLENQLYANLARKNELERQGMEATNAATQARYNAGDRDATARLLAGTLTEPKLLEMVTTQNIKPEIARTLLNSLREGDPGVDDSREVMNVETDLLNYTDEDIRNNTKLKFATRTRLIKARDTQANDWSSTQNAREAESRIDRILGIVPGTMMATLSEEKAKQRYAARTEFYNEMQIVEPPLRDAMAIPTAEKVISQYIRHNSAGQAQTIRAARASYVASHPLDSMNKESRAAYDAQLAQYDARIRDAEAKAARK